MNFMVFKNNGLVACGLLGASLCCSSLHAGPVLIDAEKAYIHNLAQDIEHVFVFFQEHIATFVDPKDKTPYREYVRALEQKIDAFEQTVMKTLAAKLVEARNQGTTTFVQGLGIVQEVLNEFLTKVHNMHDVLIKYIDVKNDFKKAVALGKELEPHIRDILDPKTISKLELKLDQLCKIVAPAGDKTLNVQLDVIKKAVKSLAGSPATKGMSGAAILNCITTKLRNNTAG